MQKDQKLYVKESDVNFRKQSEAADGSQKMTAGQELICVDGPWYRVTKDGQSGWVRADFLSETAPAVAQTVEQTLQLVIGVPNLFDTPNTAAIRKIINDEFSGGKDHLNCTEYTQYRVKTKLGVAIKWPADRPRNGGKWAAIFKRNGMFKVLTNPVPGCAMCFTAGISSDPATNAIGHVAFVEAVLDDGSVKISEANWPPAGQKPKGQYNERTIPKQKWQNQYKAQFVQFV